MRSRTCAGLGVLGCLAMSASAASACGVDGIPSLSVNGHLVAVNMAQAAIGGLDTWTPFVTRGHFAANQTLVLAEDRFQVSQALAPIAFRFPWRWRFGDGATARGTVVRHAYRHAGAYVISTEAYLVAGTRKQWFIFDRATILIR